MRSMALVELYQQVILDHNRTPRNRRELPAATHRARGLDALCGDDLIVELTVEDGRIEDAGWHGEACAVTTASASMLTEWLRGRSVDGLANDAARFRALLEDPEHPDDGEFNEINCLRAVSKFPSRVRNALLPWETALDAVSPRR
ncbi:SUF system NifU family Fe-S cluster assembly protein [Wenzhouxiangella sp. XN79A]|uniref:Fe-S cluster assembly sulfur transfer protein SufU n=1 Tax=Wenzhouxiangella sp. XN79A TaxID=2724193 RepID=UPI00144AC232|nr:SUF system NifU family Fe-S cluster assembly protein [Wenzhouxiangella sp. XN79A]NKI35559.1 SUF system NifU family Fe-S cluster assembly protein [Wenzhouxiangella sp. XN79A]